MASQNINVGTSADDGTGESLRSAFIDIRKMFAEIYGQTYTSDTQDLSGTTFSLYSKPDLTLSTNTLTLTKPDGSTDTVNLAPYLDGDITSIIAGDGLTGSSLTTGDATLNVVGGDGITVAADEVEATVDDSTIELSATNGSGALRVKDLGVTTAKLAADAVTGAKIADDAVNSEHYTDGSIDTAHIADDNITHDKLEGRYTALHTITTTAGTISLAAQTYAAFNLTGNLGTATLNIENIKKGQVIDILLSGADLSSAAITLADDFTTSTINKVGSNSLDTSKTNLIQVLCVDDNEADAAGRRR